MATAASVAACAASAGTTDDGCGDLREGAEYGTTSAGLSLGTLASGNGCSTAGAEPLSNQILDELLCLLDGRLVPVSHPNLVPQHPRVHLVLSPAARTALLAVAQTDRITINSALRTISEQYLLYRGCPVAADPGSSNHETGKAIDVEEYGRVATKLQNAGFVYPLPSSDPVHFEGPGADLRTQSVLAFQRLWNDNRPNDRLDEDGVAGPMTLARLAQSPVEGFSLAGRCVRAQGTDGGAADAGPPRDAAAPSDAGRTDGAIDAPDGAPPADAGTLADASRSADSDSGSSSDGGALGAPSASGGGCACRTSPSPRDETHGFAVAFAALAALFGRRAGRARASRARATASSAGTSGAARVPRRPS